MTSIETILDAVNKRYGFIATVLVTRDGYFLARVGDPREPTWNDPYNMFFRDAETVANTFEYLKAQPPPQMFGQGTREVLLLKPREEVVLGAVKDDARGVREMVDVSKQLQAELPALFAGLDLA